MIINSIQPPAKLSSHLERRGATQYAVWSTLYDTNEIPAQDGGYFVSRKAFPNFVSG